MSIFFTSLFLTNFNFYILANTSNLNILQEEKIVINFSHPK